MLRVLVRCSRMGCAFNHFLYSQIPALRAGPATKIEVRDLPRPVLILCVESASLRRISSIPYTPRHINLKRRHVRRMILLDHSAPRKGRNMKGVHECVCRTVAARTTSAPSSSAAAFFVLPRIEQMRVPFGHQRCSSR